MPGVTGFGVYVHWPFCARICPYCDFNVHRNRAVDSERWLTALARDLAYWASMTGGRRLSSLYFGGGTPSLAPSSVIEGVIKECARLWGFADDPEISLEANPADASPERLAALRAAGVNRLSLGVQSFDDAALGFLGRDHDGAQARQAIDAALAVFPRASADFIYALPGQSDEQWANELQAAITTGLTHLSLYQLTIEPGTAFDRAVMRKAWTPPDDDRTAALFDIAQEMTANAGLPAYEVSNHATPGAESRHNLVYWRQDDYIGVGPGAHGRLTVAGVRRATETERDPARYLAAVETKGSGAVVDVPLTEQEALTENLAMGLRTSEGAVLSDAEWRALSEKIIPLTRDGFLERRDSRLVASHAGRRLLNAVLRELL